MEAISQYIEANRERFLRELFGLLVPCGQRMPVHNREEAVIFLLKLNPVPQGQVIAHVQLARGPHAAEYRALLHLYLRLTAI